MDVSVVVPTLNSREQLGRCLDTLATEGPDETIVVNGPSADGTSGMVRDRDDVDVLVELDDRNVNVARNAGIDRARGDVVALLDHGLAVEDGWLDAIREGIADVDAVTGPTLRSLRSEATTAAPERRVIGGRAVTYFNRGNLALTRAALAALDGFDEYLDVGGARDAAHRMAAMEYEVGWEPGMIVSREFGADGGQTERDWHWRYRSLVYRMVKNYGVRPTVAGRVGRHAVSDSVGALREVAGGEIPLSRWFADGRDAVLGIARGANDALRARWRDATPRRNPNGWRARADRAVTVYDSR